MAPQTRSAAKHSPGRSTRNSTLGRPPPPPSKPRSCSPTKMMKLPVQAVPAHVPNVVVDGDVSPTAGTPWLACRDGQGVTATIAMSETGEGIHIRWKYTGDDVEMDGGDKDGDVEMTVAESEERGVTPITTGPGDAIPRRLFPQTPMPLHPYDAGSVIRTPVKKAKPLQPSPPRIGDKGIRCLYQKSGVLMDFNGAARIVLRHPVGSTANLSREQVELVENELVEAIVRDQAEKLLAAKERVEEEQEKFIDSGSGDDMQTEASDVLPPSSLEDAGDESSLVDCSCQNEANVPRRARLGPEGTELIDDSDDDDHDY